MGKAVQALEGFTANYGGQDENITPGDILDSDHELVRRYPSYFGPLNYRLAPVEEATASPGVKRATKAKPSAADK